MSYYYQQQQQYQDETASSSSASPPTTYYRTTSVSPPLSKVSVYGKSGNYMGSSSSSNSAAAELEARFEASRGFDLEDDLEFCPALVSSHYPAPQQQHQYQQSHQLHHMNNHGLLVATATSPAAPVSASPATASIKVKRKGIEIVDPTTGLKLSGKIRV